MFLSLDSVSSANPRKSTTSVEILPLYTWIFWGHILDTPITDRDDHDDVIKWKHFPRYWPFVRGIHRSPVNSLHKGQWRGVLMFSLICVWINGWVNNREAGDLRRHRAHYDVIVMGDYTAKSLHPWFICGIWLFIHAITSMAVPLNWRWS